MNKSGRLCVVVLALAASGSANAASNPTIEALQQTPISVFTYGLSALDESVNSSIGRGGTPPEFAMFKAPLSGKIADSATVIYDPDAGTVTVNLVKIEKLAISADGADEACAQGLALLRTIASLDPASGQLQAGMPHSGLGDFFAPTGTPVKAPADDLTTLDQAFRLRFVFATEAGHFDCRAPLFGTEHTLKKLAY